MSWWRTGFGNAIHIVAFRGLLTASWPMWITDGEPEALWERVTSGIWSPLSPRSVAMLIQDRQDGKLWHALDVIETWPEDWT